jgi:hypothetical protein
MVRKLIACFILIFVALTGPSDNIIYVKPESITTVLTIEGANPGAPTAVVTSNGVIYVKETPEQVLAKIKGAKEAEKPIGHDN